MSKKKKITILLGTFAALVGCWVLGDYIHSRITLRAWQEWDSEIERDATGIQEGADSWTLPGNHMALLLVHGFNDTPQTFRLMGEALQRHGYTVRAVRLPGFGEPLDKMRTCTGEDWVQCVSREAADLAESGHQVFVVGHSLGGAIAIQSIENQPNLYSGAALIAPGIDVANHRSPILPTRFWRTLGDWTLQFSDIFHSPYDRNDCRDPEHCNPEYKSPFSTRNMVQQTFQLMDQNRDSASKIRLPLLMVLTRQDQVTDWIAAEAFFDELASTQKTLRFYDSSGHAMTVDYDWQNIVTDITQFVDEIAGVASPENSP